MAWRQFDAKYWGVPQRRKRIYLVADFRGECAEKILFESKSLFRNSQQSKETGKGITTPPQNGIRAAGFDGYNGELTGNISATLGENCGLSSGRNGVAINDQGGERNTIDRHAVAYTQKAYDKYEEDNLSCSLKASGGNYGGGSETIVCDRKYIVRRLTPTECGRLQGFPDGWCKNLETETPTEKDIAFWREVFETHRKIVGQSKKPKTDKQIIKWLKNPYSDTAEYKMWGNGVALPNVEFVLSRIAECIEGKS